jgi:hypothetical protein
MEARLLPSITVAIVDRPQESGGQNDDVSLPFEVMKPPRPLHGVAEALAAAHLGRVAAVDLGGIQKSNFPEPRSRERRSGGPTSRSGWTQSAVGHRARPGTMRRDGCISYQNW